ncbi:protein phosphatase inhibitor 2-like [Ptychodera flava]|uniref:protein phosphatase inhibitor 2-like n=1 Tax=Ptychodera flava TaxID=63121 RepID=UPI00396A22AE
MAEKQVKGILKNAKYVEQPGTKSEDGVKWDEMNIIATHHPPDKDYGHMKIDEPKTPYNAMEDDDEERRAIDHDDLASKIEQDFPSCGGKVGREDKRQMYLFVNGASVPRALPESYKLKVKRDGDKEEGEEESSEEELEMTDEEREEKKKFEQKRKHHYNEFYNMKLAKKLIEQELADMEDETTMKHKPAQVRNNRNQTQLMTNQVRQAMMRMKYNSNL